MENIADKVHAILLDCLYRKDELPADGKPPEGFIAAEGIMTKFGMHPERLSKHRGEVAAILNEMPSQFHKSTGGGWSFLNLCQDKNGNQWTGEHRTMDELCSLAIGLKMAQWCLPRDMWDALPGGMPYVVFDTDDVPAESAT